MARFRPMRHTAILAIALLASALRTDAKKIGPLDDLEIKMPVDVNLADNFTPQAENVPFPAAWETKVVAPIRRDDAFFFINKVTLNEWEIYPGNPHIVNRTVVLTSPRDGVYVAAVTTDYTFEREERETLEFIKTPAMPGFAENVPRAIHVDLRQINSLPLCVEIRSEGDMKFQIFVSDIFKPFVKIGRLTLGAYVLDPEVWNTVYRSFSAEYRPDMTVRIEVTTIVRTGPRTRSSFTIELAGPDDATSVIDSGAAGTAAE